MLRNTCCVVIPGNEANGVVLNHDPSTASERPNGSDWPMTEPFIKHTSTRSHGVVDSRLFIFLLVSNEKKEEKINKNKMKD